jgi:adenine-specific DNA-methyltransferase
MRYIGNKTRLLPFLLRAVRRLGVAPGAAHDAFAGTAAVGRALKGAGWRVVSSDLMTYSYVLQRAYVVAGRMPSFRALCAEDAELARALRSPNLRARVESRNGRAMSMQIELPMTARASTGNGVSSTASGAPLNEMTTPAPTATPTPTSAPAPTRAGLRLAAIGEYLGAWLEPEPGFITANFSPAGDRMYFTEENAGRIDAARRVIHEWRLKGLIDEDAYFILLAAVIEAADRVANTAGVYAAYIKSWQSNARRPLRIAPERPLNGSGSSAHLADAAVVAREAGPLELLYIDPPYNSRQYSGYYHVPELLARGWFDDEAPTLRGKTGLLDGAPSSDWCSSKRVAGALRDLLAATDARHVLVSYNSEGLLPDDELREILREAAMDGRVRRFSHQYRRYRADSDRAGRRYKGDRVRELLYHARLR